MPIESTQVRIEDLEQIADALQNLITLVAARDIEWGALRLQHPVQSPLGQEATRLLERIEGYIKDFYYEREVESRGEPKVKEEPLADHPLGKLNVQRARQPWDFPAQAGRADEMFERGSDAVARDRETQAQREARNDPPGATGV